MERPFSWRQKDHLALGECRLFMVKFYEKKRKTRASLGEKGTTLARGLFIYGLQNVPFPIIKDRPDFHG